MKLIPKPITLHSKSEIESYLRRSTDLHLYELGDLDDFFWRYTNWYGLPGPREAEMEALALFYTGESLPVLLALQDLGAHSLGQMAALLESLQPVLPPCFYAHLNADLEQVLAAVGWQPESHGLHQKMALRQPERLAEVDTAAVKRLSNADLPAVQALYAAAYPHNWFEPRMLETGCYYGIWQQGGLVAIAGVHVFSPTYRVAALGNITTHPAWRGQGLAKSACARLCLDLLPQVDHIGLNVKASNAAAIAAYRRLGFEWVADYTEYTFNLSPASPGQVVATPG